MKHGEVKLPLEPEPEEPSEEEQERPNSLKVKVYLQDLAHAKKINYEIRAVTAVSVFAVLYDCISDDSLQLMKGENPTLYTNVTEETDLVGLWTLLRDTHFVAISEEKLSEIALFHAIKNVFHCPMRGNETVQDFSKRLILVWDNLVNVLDSFPTTKYRFEKDGELKDVEGILISDILSQQMRAVLLVEQLNQNFSAMNAELFNDRLSGTGEKYPKNFPDGTQLAMNYVTTVTTSTGQNTFMPQVEASNFAAKAKKQAATVKMGRHLGYTGCFFFKPGYDKSYLSLFLWVL